MACIVYLTDKKSGRRYAYESISYYDKEKKMPRCKRKLLGRVDEAGNIVPTSGKRKKEENKEDVLDLKKQYERIRRDNEKLNSDLDSLRRKYDELYDENKKLNYKLKKIANLLEQ